MRLITLIAVLIFTASCSSDEADKESQMLNNKSMMQGFDKRGIYNQDVAVVERNFPQIKLPTNDSKRYELNGVTFSVKSNTLSKGLSVFNPNMSEFGVLKGTFVVQTVEGLDTLVNQFNVKEIAPQIYRLTPLSKKLDLFSLYKSLQDEIQFTTVEIEIDYSSAESNEMF